MKRRIKVVLGFLNALPRLPGVLWRDRDYLAMTILGRPVGRRAKAAYAEHLASVERWQKDLYS